MSVSEIPVSCRNANRSARISPESWERSVLLAIEILGRQCKKIVKNNCRAPLTFA